MLIIYAPRGPTCCIVNNFIPQQFSNLIKTIGFFPPSSQEQLMKALCDSVCVSSDSVSTLIKNYCSHLQTVITATQLRPPQQHSRKHHAYASYTISTNPHCVLKCSMLCVCAHMGIYRVEREMAEDSRVCEVFTKGA